jgi:protein-S-isoprenylcysteine O-methyltransferase Ste14
MEGRGFYGFAAVQCIAVGALLWFVLRLPGVWDLQRALGSGLMMIGVSGIATARYQLGRSFAVRAEARRLVTHGIYSKIRNPIYTFGAILIAGFILVIHRPMLWLLLLAIIVMQIIRARREAKVLEAAFGDAYREYRRKTWF